MRSFQAKLEKAIHRLIISTVRLEAIATITRLEPVVPKPKRSRKR